MKMTSALHFPALRVRGDAMKSCFLCRLPKLCCLPWLASGICATGLGCAQPMMALQSADSTVVTSAAAPVPTGTPTAPQTPNTLPISLDTVLRLACEQNSQIALAREKLDEASAQQAVADLAWLPNVYVGTAYWRHEGGIQNEDGTLTRSSFGGMFAGTKIDVEFDAKEAAFQRVNASRQIWQRKGELSKITSETLLDAATTYIDLLLARTTEAIAVQLEKNEAELLKSARALAAKEPPARLQAEAIESESFGHRQAIAKVHQQGDAAAFKLAQLLGLDPNVKLMPVDDRLAPFAIADATTPVDELVSRALENGPGVRELQGLLGVVQSGIDKAKGPTMLLPVFELRAAEGLFGAGPGDDVRWANRLDVGVQARYNLTDFCKGRDLQRVAESKLQQLYLTHQELRQKLTIGVHEARSAIHAGESQIRYGAEQIRRACKTYQLSDERRTNFAEAKDKLNEVQVLQALRTLELAHLRYLEAVSAYDKAQLRLLVLTGAVNCETQPPSAQPSSLPTPAESCPVSSETKGK
jgi:outer membrane protein TolC